MTKIVLPLKPEQRIVLIGQVAQRLNTLDDQALLRLAEVTREPTVQPQGVADTVEQAISRRRFMTALLGGGILATTAGAVTIWQWGADQRQSLTGTIEQLSDRVGKLWGLVGLYKRLDEAPIESAAAKGIEEVGGSFKLTLEAARVVREGVQVVKDALRRVEASFPRIRDNLAWLESILTDLAGKLHLLEEAISHTLNEANPITQSLSAFFDALLRLLPFEMGQRAREILGRIGDFVASVPEAIDGISLNILIPLREEWFSDEKDKGLSGWLIEPLITRLLDPIEPLMDSLAHLNTSLDQDLDQPVKQAIKQRAQLRQQIAEYQSRYQLQEPLA